MEIYRNSSDSTVSIQIPVQATDVDVFVVANGKVIHEAPAVTYDPIASTYSVTLPWHLTRQDQEFFVEWLVKFDEHGVSHTYTERSQVQVVTPLLPLEEIADIAGYNLSTAEGRTDTLDLERTVRFAVQSYTGQNFGKFYGVMSARGKGGNKLALPAPLLEFSGMSFDGVYRPNYGVMVTGDGWTLTGGKIEITSIKQAPPEWMLDRFDYQGKITAPMLYGNHTFYEDTEYKVEGLWGYNDVPAQVRQAARLLVQDYSCDESLWRDRYITNVQAADWRFQFSPMAFAGTGNVQADQILSGYRRLTMVVV